MAHFLCHQEKGHALTNRKHLDENPHFRFEARHHNRFDHYVDVARRTFYHNYHIQLSDLLAARADYYMLFIRAVHAIIFELM